MKKAPVGIKIGNRPVPALVFSSNTTSYLLNVLAVSCKDSLDHKRAYAIDPYQMQ